MSSSLTTSLRGFSLLAMLVLSQMLVAQSGAPKTPHPSHPGCSFDHYNEGLIRKHPEMREAYEQYVRRALPILQQSAPSRSTNTIHVPVVIHIVHTGDAVGSGTNLSDERIQAQMEVLNEAFSATNANFSQTPTRWASQTDNPNIQFCLASIDPNGNATNGINRVQMTVTGPNSDTTNIETEIKPAIAWNPSLYYNVYVLPIPGTTAGGGVTGYAYLPYNGTVGNATYDGSVVDYRWFGGPGFGQSGSKTLTHETGHYLGLFHTFNGRSCTKDDGIDDTPNIGDATSASGWFSCNGGFPTGPMSCGNEHMYVNYMDYASESCVTSFTQGQVNVMRAVLDGTAGAQGWASRASLANNAMMACTFFEDDASISAINVPGTKLCGNLTVTPEVVLTNLGTTNLTSVTINYRLNGASPVSFAWTGNLTAGESETVTLAPFTASASFAFEAYTTNPNGQTDQQTANDSLSTNTTLTTTASLPIAEDFESAAFGPTSNNIDLYNVDNDSYAWERTTLTSANGSGGAAALFDNFNANNDILGTLDGLITPIFDFSTVSNAQLTFDVSYARYTDGTDTYSDSLLVIVSTDCGATYDQVVYRKGGTSLETGTATANPYMPTNSTWRKETVDLSAFNNMENVSIALINKSGWGNRLFLDNIQMQGASVDCGAYDLMTNSTPVSCFEGTDGMAAVDVVAGVGPYTTSWSNGSDQTSLTTLSAGTYTVTVEDSRGCQSSETITITEPTALTGTLSSTAVSPGSSNDGTASVSVSGGTMPYSYLWSNGATTATITQLTTGVYNVTVTDAKNCQRIDEVEVGQGTVDCSGLSFQLISKNVNCHGGSDGGATAAPQGGVAPYTILWSNSETGLTVNNLVLGDYSVTLSDSQGCTTSDVFSIDQPDALSLEFSKTDETIEGNNDGSATALVGGGTSPYTYLWSNAKTTASISQLSPGDYAVTVTDANDCQRIDEVSVLKGAVDCSSLSIQIIGEGVSCQGGSDGGATVAPQGGQGPYRIDWSTGATTVTVLNLAAGNYEVTVTDNKDCTKTASVNIEEPNALAIQLSKSDETIENKADGEASANVNGGTMPYSYLWSNGETTKTIDELAAGVYVVTVLDANECEIIDEIEIAKGAVDCSDLDLALSANSLQCFGDQNGSIAVSLQGGQGPFLYNWSNDSESPQLGNLPAGTYSLTISDNRGCTAVKSIELEEPIALMLELGSTDDTDPNKDNGTAKAIVEGGTTPYAYLWSNGETTKTIDQLSPGIYVVTVTDANGCEMSNEVAVETTVVDCSTFRLEVSKEDPLCFGSMDGVISVEAEGGTLPFSYSWSNGASVSDLVDLPSGMYSVTVTDANDCITDAMIELVQPEKMAVELTPKNGICGNKGEIATDVNGGIAPYTYVWSNNKIDDRLLNLESGDYAVTVTDANQCTVEDSATIELDDKGLETSMEKEDISCAGAGDGLLEVSVTQGTAPFTYEWSTGDTSTMIDELDAGNYTLSLQDANGCTSFSIYQIVEPAPLTLTFNTANPAMPAGNNGAIIAQANGGVTPYRYAWSNGATTTQINQLNPGTYTVTVTDGNNCQMIESVTLDISTSSKELESLTSITLYPNPTENQFQLEAFFKQSEQVDLELMDLVGRRLHTASYNSDQIRTQISLRAYPAGTYFLRLRTQHGQVTKRIVKL